MSLIFSAASKKSQGDVASAMSVAEPVAASMWAAVTGWFTPTVLFCLLNLVIVYVFISSKFRSQNERKRQNSGEHDIAQQFFRAPSLLERVKSINFTLRRSDDQPDRSPPETPIVEPEQEPVEGSDHHVIRSVSEKSGRALPARIRKSASEKAILEITEKDETVEARRPETVRQRKGRMTEASSSEEDGGVDAKADDFISRFKGQLQLQRLDSFRKYKEMLHRRT